uniref:Uncharacterized protein n=1 Tax=Romanomermis culicivorax TaxID=13658 RepID=A0A915IVU8_ROMCU
MVCEKADFQADTTTLLEHHLANFFHHDNSASNRINDHPDIGLVVDGRTLSFCLSSSNQDNFVEIISKCTSVLCCRATPLQK